MSMIPAFVCICAKSLQWCLTLCHPVDPVAHQSPLSTGFSRQEYSSGLLCPPPGDLPNPEMEPTSLTSPTLAGRFFATSATWEVLLAFKDTYFSTIQSLLIAGVRVVPWMRPSTKRQPEAKPPLVLFSPWHGAPSPWGRDTSSNLLKGTLWITGDPGAWKRVVVTRTIKPSKRY